MKKAIAGIMLAMMAISVFSLVPNPANADSGIHGMWVRMNGFVLQWNMTDGTSTRTFGWMGASAAIVDVNGTVHEWARAHATWSDILRAYPMGDHPLGDVNITDSGAVQDHTGTWTGNFSVTFSFFTAKLLSFSDLSFNKTDTGHDFYLAGNWNVSKITETINVTWSQTDRQIIVTWKDTPIAINAPGELLADWGAAIVNGMLIGAGTFRLRIDGVGTLGGILKLVIVWTKPLNVCDFMAKGSVNIQDLVRIARRYGQAPGFGSFDDNLDVDGDGRIGIGDLTTVAANIQG